MQDFKYDVAFSFLSQDESLAEQLAKLLKGRLSVFIYSEAQKDIAGKDGEVEFNKVFGQDARIVVVLYRSGWGETPWTRIEQTAIRNRGHDAGYDFCIFIPLDLPNKPPPWLPKNRLWIGLERWGVDGAAAAIEARVQDAGGVLVEETAETKARRASELVEFYQTREQWRMTEEAVNDATKAANEMYDMVEATCKRISEGNANMKMRVVRPSDRYYPEINIITWGRSLHVRWHYQARNSLRESGLHCRVIGPVNLLRTGQLPPVIGEHWYDYNIGPDLKPFWQPRDATERHSSASLAEKLVKWLVETVTEDEPWNIE